MFFGWLETFFDFLDIFDNIPHFEPQHGHIDNQHKGRKQTKGGNGGGGGSGGQHSKL